MKKTVKLFVLVTFIASIAFLMAACGFDPDYGYGWPPENTLKQFGLGGLAQPAGADYIEWDIQENELGIAFNGTLDTKDALLVWFSDWNINQPNEIAPGIFSFFGTKSGFEMVVYYSIEGSIYSFTLFAWKD